VCVYTCMQAKERAREVLARRYANGSLTQEQVLTAIYSLSDNNSYLLFNRQGGHACCMASRRVNVPPPAPIPACMSNTTPPC
jgi:hypothetical protein